MSNVLDLKNMPEPGDGDEITPELVVAQEVSPTMASLGLGDFMAAPDPISWSTRHEVGPEQRMREYIILSAVVLIGGVVAWWQSSWLILGVMVMGVVAWELRNRLPSTHQVTIDAKGVSVDGYRHRHEDLHSFDIHPMPDGSQHLSVRTTKWHVPHVRIPLADQDPEVVRALLAQYLDHDDHKIPLLDYAIHKEWKRK